MFVFSGIEFFEEIKEALVKKNVFSDIWRHFAEVLVQVSSSEHRYDTAVC